VSRRLNTGNFPARLHTAKLGTQFFQRVHFPDGHNRRLVYLCLSFCEPRAHLLQKLRRDVCEFQTGNMSFFLNPKHPAGAFKSRGCIERKSEGSRVTNTQGHHRAYREAFFANVPHHAAIGGGQLHIHQAGRALPAFLAALGVKRHSIAF